LKVRYGTFIFCLIILTVSCENKKATPKEQDNNYVLVYDFMRDKIDPLLPNLQVEEARKLLDSIYPTVQRIDQYSLTVLWLFLKEGQHTAAANFDSSRYYASRALLLASQYDTTGKDVLLAKIKLANILLENKLPDSALVYARDAYAQASIRDTIQLPLICLRLYDIYAALGDLHYMRKYAVEGFNRSRDLPVFKTYLAYAIADYYNKLGAVDSAIMFFKNVEADTTLTNLPFEAAKYENLGVLLTEKEKLNEALAFNIKALAIQRGINQINGMSYYNYSITYRKLKEFAKAHAFLDTALKLATDDRNVMLIKQIWQERALNYAADNNFKEAYKAGDSAFRSYQKEVDSSIVLNARELETKYEIKNKEEQIARLRIEQNAERALSNQRKVTIFALSLAALFIVFAGMYYVRNKREAYKIREAELLQQLLRTQMEPHFIFHFLSVLQDAIMRSEIDKALIYLTKFSRLIRLSLENARTSFVYLKDEVEALNNYLSLQQMINPSPFKYTFTIYPGYEQDDISIPPMLVQPFVENALMHGIAKIEYEGEIVVDIQKGNHALICRVEDNGVGLNEVVSQEKTSLSGKITKERLLILKKQTGHHSDLIMADKSVTNEGSGTKVMLIIPFK
jgi:tetratricopeptide (TPR) repeat protein